MVWSRVLWASARILANTHAATCWRRGVWERVLWEWRSGAHGLAGAGRNLLGCTVFADASDVGGVLRLRSVRRRRVPRAPVLFSKVASWVAVGKGPNRTVLTLDNGRRRRGQRHRSNVERGEANAGGGPAQQSPTEVEPGGGTAHPPPSEVNLETEECWCEDRGRWRRTTGRRDGREDGRERG
jgi:hypothetical protein